MTGDGNGWVDCACRARHWGRFGAAGILITDGERVMLQLRAGWTHQGGTWALPGGARDSHEDALTAALREAAEEIALDPASVRPFDEYEDHHGTWSYTTVIAHTHLNLALDSVNAESTAVRWFRLDDVAELPLHIGFRAAWPHLHEKLTRATRRD